MIDNREIAMDDIFDELEELSEEGRKELNIEPKCVDEEVKNSVKTWKEVPFCCTTTLPKEFNVKIGCPHIAWLNCLKCVEVLQQVEAKCPGNGEVCGTIDACVLRIVGCIPFIASTEVEGDGPTKCNPEICCSCCLCVDECISCSVDCTGGVLPCSEMPEAKIRLKSGTFKACKKTCEPCPNGTPPPGAHSECQIVTFSGILEVGCEEC